MKNLFLSITFLFIGLIGVISCNKEEGPLYKNPGSNNRTSNSTQTNEVVKHIYYAQWEEFGRTSRSCEGFGLCYFQDCFNCCTDNGVIVNCPDNMLKTKAGLITLTEGTPNGILTIKLNPVDEEQRIAIEEGETFYIDEQLESDLFIVHAGEYPYNPSIGLLGGYEIPVTKK